MTQVGFRIARDRYSIRPSFVLKVVWNVEPNIVMASDFRILLCMTFHLLKGEYMAEIISYTIHGRGSDLISVFLQPNSAEASVLIPDFYAFHRTGQCGIQFLGKTVASNGTCSC